MGGGNHYKNKCKNFRDGVVSTSLYSLSIFFIIAAAQIILVYFPESGKYACLNKESSKKHLKKGTKVEDVLALRSKGQMYSSVVKCIGK